MSNLVSFRKRSVFMVGFLIAIGLIGPEGKKTGGGV